MPLDKSGIRFARWRCLPNLDLHWRLWEDQYVVYNSASGHTHVLEPLAALLIQRMTQYHRDTSELVQQIGTLLNLEPTEEFHKKLDQTLWQLDELGLVEAVTS